MRSDGALAMDQDFWIGLLQIVWIDLLLSGDNAIVIALACRSLPDRQKRLGIALGAATAVGLRVVLATFIVYLMEVPFLKLTGGLLLFWIAVKLLLPAAGHGEHVAAGANLFGAVRTIVIADVAMSFDNVIAIAAASHGSVVLLVLGLLISIPLILFSSSLILRLIERFPVFVYAGAALLGYIAGETLITDPAVAGWIEGAAFLHHVTPAAGAVFTVTVGWFWSRARARRTMPVAAGAPQHPPVDASVPSRGGDRNVIGSQHAPGRPPTGAPSSWKA
jgi:YjbE family integral membrane protein